MVNYESFEENREAAQQELEREAAAGYVEFFESQQQMEDLLGKAHPSRMAAIIKVKDNETKVRLIHDLRRSGMNARVRNPERVVLPRIRDAINDVLRQMRAAGAAD